MNNKGQLKSWVFKTILSITFSGFWVLSHWGIGIDFVTSGLIGFAAMVTVMLTILSIVDVEKDSRPLN